MDNDTQSDDDFKRRIYEVGLRRGAVRGQSTVEDEVLAHGRFMWALGLATGFCVAFVMMEFLKVRE